MVKKKKTIDLMPAKPKTLLPEHKIKFGYNNNHVMLIIQNSVLLLNWFRNKIINWYFLPSYGIQSTIVYHLQEINKILNSWLFKVVAGYDIKLTLAA